ncbi:hypothetical protein E6C76_16205 [Pseudothauera nasutitermitis]|uniref:Uncharacterized protein n=1 Tax=Pseudothauera nasutitermitis TaxID=2565930 RepID=A0A4S4ASJ3_9RHOO|nr:hypothetical protein [Pseudothauera nasutitermitis]THF62814.1 hypothetical protein E6C76_16205 [Pseudothauera nasutitermitis]
MEQNSIQVKTGMKQGVDIDFLFQKGRGFTIVWIKNHPILAISSNGLHIAGIRYWSIRTVRSFLGASKIRKILAGLVPLAEKTKEMTDLFLLHPTLFKIGR